MIDPAYLGREQTLVKHEALRHYLKRFALIVGGHWGTLIYVDCFSGPWNCVSEKFSDSSFAIAIEQLKVAKAYYEERGRKVSLKCFFVEKDESSYQKLEGFLREQDGLEIAALNDAFEDAIPSIRAFVAKSGDGAFPFFFIDPTGWTGFSMKVIGPLLSAEPSEVLVNFMTGHIRRFLELEESQESFELLFGSDVRPLLRGLTGQDREDAAVFAYARNLREACGYNFTCVAAVIKNDEDCSHFHLIYGTRNARGVEVFKNAERKAMAISEKARIERQKRDGGTGFLFDEEELGPSRYYGTLRARYLNTAMNEVRKLLTDRKELRFDDLSLAAAFYPLVWESDVKDWVEGWEAQGMVENLSKQPRQRVPKSDDLLRWKGPSS